MLHKWALEFVVELFVVYFAVVVFQVVENDECTVDAAIDVLS